MPDPALRTHALGYVYAGAGKPAILGLLGAGLITGGLAVAGLATLFDRRLSR